MIAYNERRKVFVRQKHMRKKVDLDSTIMCTIKENVIDTKRDRLYHPPPQPAEGPAKSSNKTPIILGVLGGLALIITICLFANERRLKSAIF